MKPEPGIVSFLYICLLSICLSSKDSIKFDGVSREPRVAQEPPQAARIL